MSTALTIDESHYMAQLAHRALEAGNRALEAGQSYARYVGEELQLNAQKDGEWEQAVLRLMQTENPLTKKAHSGSSAIAVVATEPAYRQLLDDLRAVVVYKERARIVRDVELERAKLYRTLIEQGAESAVPA